jgi:hypothetical protein
MNRLENQIRPSNDFVIGGKTSDRKPDGGQCCCGVNTHRRKDVRDVNPIRMARRTGRGSDPV